MSKLKNLRDQISDKEDTSKKIEFTLNSNQEATKPRDISARMI